MVSGKRVACTIFMNTSAKIFSFSDNIGFFLEHRVFMSFYPYRARAKTWVDTLSLHTAVLLMGLSALFVQWVDTSIFVLTFWRCVLGAATLGLWHACQHLHPLGRMQPFKPFVQSLGGQIGLRLLIGGALLASHWGMFFYSVQQAGVAVGVVAYAVNPLLTALLEALLLGGRFSFGMVFSACLSVLGVWVLSGHKGMMLTSTLHQNPILFGGVGWGIASGFSFSLLTIQNRWLMQRFPAPLLASAQQLLAAFILIPFAWPAHILLHLQATQWIFLFALGVFCTGIAHMLFIRSLRTFSARQATLSSSLEVVYAIGFAWLFMNHTPLLHHWIGAACVLLAVVSMDRQKQH